MTIYELAIEYNTAIRIVDQHGIYGVVLLKYAKRYGVDADILMANTSLHLPYSHFGLNIVNLELQRGGCKSLATNTRIFLSHKRSSAQGMVGRIYEGLKEDYQVFLDSEADFDLHDLAAIVKNTQIFIFVLTEGILDSFWCLQELRSAIENKKRILIIREYHYHLPEVLPAELQDLHSTLYECKVLEYMAEFYVPFMAALKKEIGIADSLITLCDTQIAESSGFTPGLLEKIKSGELDDGYALNCSSDSTDTQLRVKDLLRYYQHFGNDLTKIVSLPSKLKHTLEDIIYLGDHCPDYNGTIPFDPETTDYDIVKILDGKRFTKVTGVSIGDNFDARTGPVSGIGIKHIIKNLPNLKSLFVYNCRSIMPDDWNCVATSKLTSLGIESSNYKPNPGANVPATLTYLYGLKEKFADIMKEHYPNVRVVHPQPIREMV